MLASELIDRLREVVAESGDLPVTDQFGDVVDAVEPSTDGEYLMIMTEV